MKSINRLQAAAILLAVLAWLPATADATPFEGFAEYRSIFIDRFGDYPYDGDIPAMVTEINSLMQKAANDGFTEIIWQVRGRGEALYNSNVEPKQSAEEGRGPLTPGFDPLQTAIDAAQARGLKLHAWINVVPLWREATTPPAGHIYHNTNPSFRLRDINGNLEPASGWSNYSSVNPILPEVHDHINNVVSDITTNYAVDGIHLDYIRYLPGTFSASNNFARMPHDPISHQMFFQATGLDASNSANFNAYKAYLTDRITDMVRSIKDNIDATEAASGRTIELTASVFFDPFRAKNEYGQDFGRWINEGLLDVAMPMIYLSQLNDHLYDGYLQNALSFVNEEVSTRVAPTLATYLHMNPSRGGGVDLTLSQMQRAYEFGAHGVGFYDFPAFFNAYSVADRQRIKDFFDALLPPPPPGPGKPIEDFEAGHGHFKWAWNHSPTSQTFGLVGGEGGTSISRVSSEAQNGAWSQLLDFVADSPTTSWQQRHNSSTSNQPAHPSGNVPLAPTGYIGFWLKTDDSGAQVRIAIDDPVPDGSTAIELGAWQDVAADGQWHLYQWNLEDASQWFALGNPGSNGIIDAYYGSVTLDSIWFAGTGHAQIYLDTVSHNPDGPLTAAVRIAGDFNGDGVVDAADYDTWRATFGRGVAAGIGADANGDGVVDLADYVAWRKQMSAAAAGNTAALSDVAAVPEPASALLFLAATVALLTMRRPPLAA